jgi:hypothetical protein
MSDTGHRWERPVSVVALVISLLTVVVSWIAYYQPRAEERKEREVRIEQFLDSITAVGEQGVIPALNYVESESPAERYVTVLSRLWEGAAKSTPRIELAKPGQHTKDGESYEVCMPGVDFLMEGCHLFGNFQLSDDGRAIETFSVDKLPVARLFWTDQSDAAVNERPDFDLRVFRRDGLIDPDKGGASIALELKPNDSVGVNEVVTVDRLHAAIMDERLETYISKDLTIYVPRQIKPFEEVYATVRMPVLPDGFLELCLVGSSDERCEVVYLED